MFTFGNYLFRAKIECALTALNYIVFSRTFRFDNRHRIRIKISTRSSLLLPIRAEIGATSATKRPSENVRVRTISSLG